MRYLAVLLMLGACAATQPKTESRWEKPGATEQDFFQDRGQCVAQSAAAPFGPISMQAMLIFMGCMQGKGWYTVERAITPAP